MADTAVVRLWAWTGSMKVVKYSREKDKDHESIQSCTTPDTTRHMESDRKHNTQESKVVGPFPAGDQKAARNRQNSIININIKFKW